MDVETQLGKLPEYNPGTKDEFDPIKMKFVFGCKERRNKDNIGKKLTLP